MFKISGAESYVRSSTLSNQCPHNLNCEITTFPRRKFSAFATHLKTSAKLNQQNVPEVTLCSIILQILMETDLLLPGQLLKENLG